MSGVVQVLIDTGRSKFWVVENYGPDIYDQIKDIPQGMHVEPPLGKIYGKMCYQRRDIGFYSDESIGYEYSNQIMPSTPLSACQIFQFLLPEVNRTLNTQFNGILVNRYKNGEKYLGYHSDSEVGLDPNRSMVAGISYGPGVRIFRIREKLPSKAGPIVLDYHQQPGTLIVMEGDFQKEFTHEIPVQKRVKEERVSITFRHHIK